MIKNIFNLSAFLIVLFILGCSPPGVLSTKTSNRNYYSIHPRPDQPFEKTVTSIVRLISTNQKYYGAGVIISSEGVILTSGHIANNSKNWWVYFFNSEEQIKSNNSTIEYLEASVVEIDKKRDLALLRIKSNSLFTPMKLGEVPDLKVGQQVFSIAHPSKQYFSFLEGRISRLLDDYDWVYKAEKKFIFKKNESFKANVIQIQMPENEGNSGGPIIDNRGRLIGISTLAIKKGQSLSFAVQIDEIKEFLNDAGY